MGHLGFSYVGLIFLLLLFIPNLLWARYMPKEGDAPEKENRILRILERTGQISTICCALIFSDFNLRAWSAWSWWLVAACILLALYELWWIRYFRSKRERDDFYGRFLGIPYAGAVLPVLAFFLLGVYGKVVWMGLSAAILGIGHIGIPIQHGKALGKGGDA